MQKKLIILLFFLLILSWGCVQFTSDNAATKNQENKIEQELPAGIKASLGVDDDEEGTDPDFERLYVYYDDSNVYVYQYFHNAVSIATANPFLYLYDTIDSGTDRDKVIFPTDSTFTILRDKDNNGTFETTVITGGTVYQYYSGELYIAAFPKTYLPDIGARIIWSYCMSSTDRVPDSSYLQFNNITSVTETDSEEGNDPDFLTFEAGYDSTQVYVEFEYYNAEANLSWGEPYIRFYDQVDGTQRFLLAFNSNTSYQLKQDANADGYFETVVYNGSSISKLDSGIRYTVTIPRTYLTDISTKNMWIYSMDSTDRAPDSGYMTF